MYDLKVFVTQEAADKPGWSEAHDVDMMPQSPLGAICTAATVHFAVADFASLETPTTPAEQRGGRDDDRFFPARPKIENAHYVVADPPGLGIEVNEEAIRQQSFKFWDAPRLRRDDGSVTNW